MIGFVCDYINNPTFIHIIFIGNVGAPKAGDKNKQNITICLNDDLWNIWLLGIMLIKKKRKDLMLLFLYYKFLFGTLV